MKQTVYVMMGVPGSGKSDFSKRLSVALRDTEVVSKDTVRKALGEGYNSLSNIRVQQAFNNQIESKILSGKNVVADATHLNKLSRSFLLRQVGIYDLDIVGICLNPSVGTCIQRNLKRPAGEKISIDSIKQMHTALELPTKEEGFSDVRIVGKGE